MLGGREALPGVFNLQIITTKSFRVTFKVRLWAEGPSCTGYFGFVAALWEAAAVLQPVRRGHFPQRLGCVYWTLSALKWGKENTSFCGDAVAEKKILGLCFFSSFRFALVLPGVKYNCQQLTRKGNVSFPVEENIKGLTVKGKGKLKNATWLPPSCISPQQNCLC